MSLTIGRKIVTFCVGLLAPALLGGALRADSGLAAIKRKGTLVVGTASGYYPFEMVDKQNALVGFDIDIAKAIAKDLGVKLEWQNYAFSGLIPAMQSNKVDMVIAGMTATDKRKEVVDFTAPYFTSGQALLVSKNVPSIKKWQDLDQKGWVIAVSQGTTADQTASRMFKNATVKKFDGSALAGLELLNGKAQAVIHEVPWVAIYNRLHPAETYAILEPFTTEPLGIAVPKGDRQLVDYLNGFLAKYQKSDEYTKAYRYWFVTMDWWNGVPLKK